MNKTTKLYVGKVFSLKNYHTFPGTMLTREQIGNNVLIIDETSKKVKIIPNSGRPFWLSKFYLAQEIIEQIDDNVEGELAKIIVELSSIVNNDLKEDNKVSSALYQLLKRLKAVQEDVKQ